MSVAPSVVTWGLAVAWAPRWVTHSQNPHGCSLCRRRLSDASSASKPHLPCPSTCFRQRRLAGLQGHTLSWVAPCSLESLWCPSRASVASSSWAGMFLHPGQPSSCCLAYPACLVQGNCWALTPEALLGWAASDKPAPGSQGSEEKVTALHGARCHGRFLRRPCSPSPASGDDSRETGVGIDQRWQFQTLWLLPLLPRDLKLLFKCALCPQGQRPL